MIWWQERSLTSLESEVEAVLNVADVLSYNLGREERYFDKFVVSPDNQFLVFLGKDGYMPLVSNKV